MINFDSITKKAFKNIIQIGHKALVIFTEHQHFQAKDLEKANVLRNLISHQTDTDKIYFYAKDCIKDSCIS